MIKYLIIMLLALLTGCATPTDPTQCTSFIVKEVKVPVPMFTRPPATPRPKMTSADLTSTDNDVFIKALKSDLIIINKYVTDLEAILGVYSEK